MSEKRVTNPNTFPSHYLKFHKSADLSAPRGWAHDSNWLRGISNNVFKKSSTMLMFFIAGAFVTQTVLGSFFDRLWERINKDKLLPAVLDRLEQQKQDAELEEVYKQS
eukprot:TRINITY_DN27651_c0_g1_i1.p1 TRINITY_DN27651_c0_g1~~TRINITY_DN27651_c0_g1_i1.p1  ORF type:complete len:108 (-),score=21.56 TRINITY_DN27651_c0_g1_i1:79-402(-)